MQSFLKSSKATIGRKRLWSGDIIGGILVCSALWHILSIDTLWVKKEYRNQELGNNF